MALNKDRIRKEREKRQKGSYYKLEDGKHILRLLPLSYDEEVYAEVFAQHWIEMPDGTRMSMICTEGTPIYGTPCSICKSLVPKAYAISKDAGNRIRAKTRGKACVVDMQHPDDGVKVIDLPVDVLNQIDGLVLDGDFEVADQEEGVPIIITRKKDASGFPKYEVMPGKGAVPVSDEIMAARLDVRALIDEVNSNLLMEFRRNVLTAFPAIGSLQGLPAAQVTPPALPAASAINNLAATSTGDEADSAMDDGNVIDVTPEEEVGVMEVQGQEEMEAPECFAMLFDAADTEECGQCGFHDECQEAWEAENAPKKTPAKTTGAPVVAQGDDAALRERLRAVMG